MIQRKARVTLLVAGVLSWALIAPGCGSSDGKKKSSTRTSGDYAGQAGETTQSGGSQGDPTPGAGADAGGAPAGGVPSSVPGAAGMSLGGTQGDAGSMSVGEGGSVAGTAGSDGNAGSAASAGQSGAAGEGGNGSGLDADGCGATAKNCDHSDPDCETEVNTVTACGACDVHCDAVHGTPICKDYKCVVPAGKCDAGYADCDDDGRNGCETSIKTDGNNCGVCGRVCQGGTPCSAGQCGSVLVVDVGNSIAGEDVFFTQDNVFFSSWDKANTQLGWAPRNPATFPATPTWFTTTAVNSITGDANSVYFLRDPYGSVHSIRKVAADGSGLVTQVNDDVGDSGYLRSNATAFFVLNSANIATGISTLAKTSTGSPVPIVTGRNRILQLLVTKTKLVWIENATPGENAAVQNIYVAPLAGGSGTDITMIPGNLVWDADYYRGDLTSDGTYLYWPLAGSGSGKIRRYALDGSGQPEDLAFDLTNPTSPVVDEKYVYYLANNNSSLFRVNKEGGAVLPELITTDTGNMAYLDLVDDKFVWGHNNYSLAQIRRTPK